MYFLRSGQELSLFLIRLQPGFRPLLFNAKVTVSPKNKFSEGRKSCLTIPTPP